MDSLIIQFIKEHPDNWMELLKEKKIKVHFDHTCAIFNYDIDANFADPIVQEARGIIIDMCFYATKVVCWPFRKFGNYGESYADKIDWASARVQEKIDGSIVKLYWYNGQWRWATNGVINAENANVPLTNLSYLDLIHKADNYKDIDFDSLSKNYTYIFELVSPYNRIVIDYKKTSLYHIGTRCVSDGMEYNLNIGIQQPKEYPICTFEDALAAAEAMNQDTNFVEHEGFVVVDKYWNRIKIKSPAYLALHHAWNNNNYLINKNDTIAAILRGDWDNFFSLTNSHPYKAQIHYYAYQIQMLKWEVRRYIRYTRLLYEEYSHERKAVAMQIKNDRLAYFGFKAIGNDLTVDQIVDKMQASQLAKYIPDFELPDFLGEY